MISRMSWTPKRMSRPILLLVGLLAILQQPHSKCGAQEVIPIGKLIFLLVSFDLDGIFISCFHLSAYFYLYHTFVGDQKTHFLCFYYSFRD